MEVLSSRFMESAVLHNESAIRQYASICGTLVERSYNIMLLNNESAAQSLTHGPLKDFSRNRRLRISHLAIHRRTVGFNVGASAQAAVSFGPTKYEQISLHRPRKS